MTKPDRPIRFILMDIEGTTTDIRFVHRVLFPYSEQHLPAYLKAHAEDPAVRQALAETRETIRHEKSQTEEGRAKEDRTIDEADCVDVLLAWIRSDRKHPALKTLQGLVWEEGFRRGEFQGHVYEDVPECLEAWKAQGIDLGIYSSGSVQAQKLLFGYSTRGDLTPFFSHHFDIAVGAKRDPAAYRAIAAQLGLPPAGILFLSDTVEELDAAAQAGFLTTHVVREGEGQSAGHPVIRSFRDIQAAPAPTVFSP